VGNAAAMHTWSTLSAVIYFVSIQAIIISIKISVRKIERKDEDANHWRQHSYAAGNCNHDRYIRNRRDARKKRQGIVVFFCNIAMLNFS
jgi:uncharacterized membrane protein